MCARDPSLCCASVNAREGTAADDVRGWVYIVIPFVIIPIIKKSMDNQDTVYPVRKEKHGQSRHYQCVANVLLMCCQCVASLLPVCC